MTGHEAGGGGGWRAPVELRPIGVVRSPRTEATDDDWGDVAAVVALDADRFGPELVEGLDAFSHVEVVFLFHGVDEAAVTLGARHPRGNPDWPRVGILAQRAKARPNRLGVTTCALVGVDGLTLGVRGLDAIDGTPVLDVKPHMAEFGPRGPVRQPPWSRELMAGYW
jgi:tRNA-Thr(GGU) m(6)t(6)A37 methyltransferase TsaA